MRYSPLITCYQPDFNTAPPISTTPVAAGVDFESLTLMRMRQAKRERLEREIREREAAEGD